jgi:hypothetical protein
VARPSQASQEYWHIGETMTRFGTVVSRSSSGENNAVIAEDSLARRITALAAASIVVSSGDWY